MTGSCFENVFRLKSHDITNEGTQRQLQANKGRPIEVVKTGKQGERTSEIQDMERQRWWQRSCLEETDWCIILHEKRRDIISHRPPDRQSAKTE